MFSGSIKREYWPLVNFHCRSTSQTGYKFHVSVILKLISPKMKELILHKKSFSLKISSVNVSLQETADLVTFTEEILNGKLHFLRSVSF